jgi:pyruvate dehydrogenase E1 component
VILHHGLKRMVEKQDNVFYYLTLLNENYAMPGLTAGTEEQIIKGMYLLEEAAPAGDAARQPAGQRHHPAREHGGQGAAGEPTGAWPPTSGAARASTSWPATARTASAGTCCTRPTSRACPSWPAAGAHAGPVVASTDYMKNYAEQIRAFIPKGRAYKVLGTDGFGRSDFRSKLREHFEINRHYIVVAALKALADEGTVPAWPRWPRRSKYGIDADKRQPAVRLRTTRIGDTHGIGRSEGAGHRRLQGSGRHRTAGQAWRHRRGRAEPHHGGERQGVDGDSVQRMPAW